MLLSSQTDLLLNCILVKSNDRKHQPKNRSSPMTHINLEKLAAHSLSMTGEHCPDTMLAHYASLNPSASDEQINTAHELIEEFVEDAI